MYLADRPQNNDTCVIILIEYDERLSDNMSWCQKILILESGCGNIHNCSDYIIFVSSFNVLLCILLVLYSSSSNIINLLFNNIFITNPDVGIKFFI